jgi:hypothetical protein
VTGAIGGNKSYSSSCSRSPFSLHRVGNEASSSTITYSFPPGQGLFWFLLLANNQLDALSRVFIYFTSLHVSNITVLIIRRSNCINTSSGLISLCKRLFGMLVRRDRHTKQSLTQLIIPDDVLIQFDLLMMSTVMLEISKEVK